MKDHAAWNLWHVGWLVPQSDWRMAAHRHEHFNELIVVIAGQIETVIGGRTLVGRAGDVLLYPRGMDHAERAAGATPLETVFVGWADPRRDLSGLPLIRRDTHGRIQTLVRWMYSLRSASDPASRAVVDGLMRAALFEYTSTDPSADEASTRVKRFIQENLSVRLCLDDLAGVACMSRFHFARAFKRAVGKSPMRYVREARVEAARTLLLSSDLPLRAIAPRVGFPNEFHLSRAFRRQTGRSPRTLRRG